MMHLSRYQRWVVLCVLLALASFAWGESRFPPPDFETTYTVPEWQDPAPARRAPWTELLDVGLLALALSLATWIALKKRSRRWMIALSIACLVYFDIFFCC